MFYGCGFLICSPASSYEVSKERWTGYLSRCVSVLFLYRCGGGGEREDMVTQSCQTSLPSAQHYNSHKWHCEHTHSHKCKCTLNCKPSCRLWNNFVFYSWSKSYARNTANALSCRLGWAIKLNYLCCARHEANGTCSYSYTSQSSHASPIGQSFMLLWKPTITAW